MNKQKDIIENEYLNRLKNEVAELRSRVFEAEDELRHLKQSRLISLAIKIRPVMSKWLLAFRSVKNNIRKNILFVVSKIIPRKAKPLIKYVVKLRWLVKREVIRNEKYSNKLPLISVVIPYYNAGATIEETVDSLRNQTFKNFDVTIVNDGSTDERSVDTLPKIKSGELNLSIINQENKGVAAARNAGISGARGKYIVCLDSDDILDDTFLEKCLTVIETNPNIELASTDMRIFGVRNLNYQQAEYDASSLLNNNMVITASMFNRRGWQDVGGYTPGIGYEDWNFWISLAEKGYWGKRIAEPIFNYRTAASSRYIDDQANHKTNVNKIHMLHHGYERKIRAIKRYNYFNEKVIKKDSLFVNLCDSSDYVYPSNNKPNILISIPWMTFGGAETLVVNYCSQIKNDCNISFITGLRSEHEWEYKFKEITNRIYHLANLFDSKDLYLEFISNYISTRKIDILHIIHNGFMFDILPELKLRHPKLKVVVTMFNDRVEYFSESIKYTEFIDDFISDNDKVADNYRKTIGELAKVTVIPNGVDCFGALNLENYDREEQRKKLNIKKNDLAVFFVGRLSSEKNPDVFIEAAADLVATKNGDSLKFFVIGDGIMKSKVKAMIHKTASSNIQYLGYQSDVASMLCAADVFVLPSSIEGFPLSILEAMSMQVVTIASNVGAVSDILEDGKDGFIIKPGSADEICDSVIKLQINSKLLNRMKIAARNKLEKKYSNKILKNNYLKMYKDVMK